MKKQKCKLIIDQYREKNRKLSESEGLFSLFCAPTSMHFSISNVSPNNQNAKKRDMKKDFKLKMT